MPLPTRRQLRQAVRESQYRFFHLDRQLNTEETSSKVDLTPEQKLRIANQLHHDYFVALRKLGLLIDEEHQHSVAMQREQNGEVEPFDVYKYACRLGITSKT